jgi:CheY-like chemotaxis protein
MAINDIVLQNCFAAGGVDFLGRIRDLEIQQGGGIDQSHFNLPSDLLAAVEVRAIGQGLDCDPTPTKNFCGRHCRFNATLYYDQGRTWKWIRAGGYGWCRYVLLIFPWYNFLECSLFPRKSIHAMSSRDTILIVDDNRLARMMARSAVETAAPEANVIEADCGADALEKVTGEIIDIALVDLNMPGIDGLELAKELRSRFANIRLALCTANIQETTRNRAEEQNIIFIDKPIDAAKVEDFLQNT